MTETIQFNTGRKYTAEGQVIVATLHTDGVVTFMDHSRGIDGQFIMPLHCTLNQAEVMHHYDNMLATRSERSWRDGMMKEGCNTRR